METRTEVIIVRSDTVNSILQKDGFTVLRKTMGTRSFGRKLYLTFHGFRENNEMRE
jgi:hypothetical protein